MLKAHFSQWDNKSHSWFYTLSLRVFSNIFTSYTCIVAIWKSLRNTFLRNLNSVSVYLRWYDAIIITLIRSTRSSLMSHQSHSANITISVQLHMNIKALFTLLLTYVNIKISHVHWNGGLDSPSYVTVRSDLRMAWQVYRYGGIQTVYTMKCSHGFCIAAFIWSFLMDLYDPFIHII